MNNTINIKAPRVLVVEDEVLVGEMLLGILRAMKYQVVGVVGDGTQAVALAQVERPDVILLDIGLAGIDGIEVTRQIQTVCPTPIVALTAYDDQETLLRATAAGVGAYLTKPVTPHSLQNAITTVTARFNDMMELRRLNDQLQAEIAMRQHVEAERTALLKAEREQRLLAETLAEVTLALTSQTQSAIVLDEILNHAQRIVAFKSAIIMLLDGNVLRSERWRGYERDAGAVADTAFHLDDFAVNAEVVRTRKPLIIPDVRLDPRWVVIETSSWIRSVMMVPICVHERVLGLLNLDSAEVGAFTEEDAARLMPLASAAGIAIENARLMQNLEAEVALRTAEIAEERDKSNAILRGTGDAIIVLGNDLRIQYVNPAFEQLTGYASSECLGKIIHQVIIGQLGEPGMRGMKSAYETSTEWRGEVMLTRRDGRTYDATMTVAPILDASGVLLGHVVSHQDISRFKALERARNQFITSISHELRTPLTVLDLSVRKMKRAASSEADVRLLDAMTTQIAHLVRFTEDILEMAALDSGKGTRVWEPVHMVSLVLDTVRRYQAPAAKAGLLLMVSPPPSDVPVVHGDSKRVAQVLAKLVENAVTFTPSGGQVCVEINTVHEDGRAWVTISVADTGPGILPEEIDRIFDRFFRGHLTESGHILGSGLGLSIAQEIARAHGGRITVESVLGQGATFVVWLPAVS